MKALHLSVIFVQFLHFMRAPLRHNVQPHFCMVVEGGRGGEPPTKFSKRGGLDRVTNFRSCWQSGGDFSRGEGCNFHIESKWKSEILNDQKCL